MIEQEALQRAGEGPGFKDYFHRKAIEVVVESFLASEMREFVIALPLAATLEKKLRIERSLALLKPGKGLPKPIFIVGLPRTGSTLLHQLCGLDPRARPMRSWELKMPVASSEAPASPLQRRQKVQNILNIFYRLAPRIKAVHLVAADDPDECVQGYLDCVLPDMYCWGAVSADAAFDWFVKTDMTPMLRNYKNLIRVILDSDQLSSTYTHLILKSPHHTWKLPDLARAFPNAQFVWIHRSPISTVGSTCSMNEAILDATAAHFVHPHILGRRTMDRLAQCLGKGLADRTRMRQSKFVDVRYEDLKRDPLGALSQMYGQLGLNPTLDPEFIGAVAAKLAADEASPWKRHSYSLDHFGLTEDVILERFDFYKRSWYSSSQSGAADLKPSNGNSGVGKTSPRTKGDKKKNKQR